MDEAAKKAVLRMWSYGLFAVTTRHGEQVNGMLVNWISQSSFDPPMVMMAVENDALSLKLIERSGHFAVNVLESGQRELAGHLARRSAKLPDKMASVEWEPGPLTGCPLLKVALGWLECRVTGFLPSGDHMVVVAEIIEAGLSREGQPLTMAETGFRYYG